MAKRKQSKAAKSRKSGGRKQAARPRRRRGRRGTGRSGGVSLAQWGRSKKVKKVGKGKYQKAA